MACLAVSEKRLPRAEASMLPFRGGFVCNRLLRDGCKHDLVWAFAREDPAREVDTKNRRGLTPPGGFCVRMRRDEFHQVSGVCM